MRKLIAFSSPVGDWDQFLIEMIHHADGIIQGRLDILTAKPGIFLDDFREGRPVSEHLKEDGDGNPGAADDGTTAQDFGIHGDAVESRVHI